MNQMQHDLVRSPVAKDYGDIIGTPFKVFLVNGVEEKFDSATGKTKMEIIDLPGLICSILQCRALHPRKFSGDDLKFMRSALQMKSSELAEKLDVSPEHYSRCESGSKTLSTASEKFLRMFVFLQATSKNKFLLDHIQEQRSLKAEDPEKLKEEAKEAVEAFKSLFFDMKIENICLAGDKLSFSFLRKPRCEHDECEDCGNKEDVNAKWRKEPEKKAA